MQTVKNFISEQDYLEISEVFMCLPFNTSLVGYQMLINAVGILLNTKEIGLSLNGDIYKTVGENFCVNAKFVEKSIRNLLSATSDYCAYYSKVIQYPNLLIKHAVEDGHPKSFIFSICEYLKLKRFKQKLVEV